MSDHRKRAKHCKYLMQVMTMNELAYKKWLKIPQNIRQKIEKNVWCVNCMRAVEIVHYEVELRDIGLILNGQCKNCGHEVARVIENS